MKTDEHAVVAGCATGRGPGLLRRPGAPAALGGWGNCEAPGHPDLESEKILRALAGESYACLDVLEAWEVHADDLRVLVLASRGPTHPGRGPAGRAWADEPGGWTGPAAAASMRRRRAAVTAVMGAGCRVRSGNLRTPCPCCSAWAVRCRPG